MKKILALGVFILIIFSTLSLASFSIFADGEFALPVNPGITEFDISLPGHPPLLASIETVHINDREFESFRASIQQENFTNEALFSLLAQQRNITPLRDADQKYHMESIYEMDISKTEQSLRLFTDIPFPVGTNGATGSLIIYDAGTPLAPDETVILFSIPQYELRLIHKVTVRMETKLDNYTSQVSVSRFIDLVMNCLDQELQLQQQIKSKAEDAFKESIWGMYPLSRFYSEKSFEWKDRHGFSVTLPAEAIHLYSHYLSLSTRVDEYRFDKTTRLKILSVPGTISGLVPETRKPPGFDMIRTGSGLSEDGIPFVQIHYKNADGSYLYEILTSQNNRMLVLSISSTRSLEGSVIWYEFSRIFNSLRFAQEYIEPEEPDNPAVENRSEIFTNPLDIFSVQYPASWKLVSLSEEEDLPEPSPVPDPVIWEAVENFEEDAKPLQIPEIRKFQILPSGGTLDCMNISIYESRTGISFLPQLLSGSYDIVTYQKYHLGAYEVIEILGSVRDEANGANRLYLKQMTEGNDTLAVFITGDSNAFDTLKEKPEMHELVQLYNKAGPKIYGWNNSTLVPDAGYAETVRKKVGEYFRTSDSKDAVVIDIQYLSSLRDILVQVGNTERAGTYRLKLDLSGTPIAVTESITNLEAMLQ
ncbi:MAG TPA: hypothetical protein DD727_03790, partial [Clostridiales bacterium]|nr:hypothetical protein [Clostridiales bacterium]